MKASERREEIVRMATSNGLASVEEFSRTFGVTASTIRRDLSALEKSGRLARTYGGVIAVGSRHREMSLGERSGDSYRAKDAIGRRAAAQVSPGETVLLDAGTTTARVAAQRSTSRARGSRARRASCCRCSVPPSCLRAGTRCGRPRGRPTPSPDPSPRRRGSAEEARVASPRRRRSRLPHGCMPPRAASPA